MNPFQHNKRLELPKLHLLRVGTINQSRIEHPDRDVMGHVCYPTSDGARHIQSYSWSPVAPG
jgi:hypothetical protein